MIVCICRGASERDVLEAIEDGARSIRDLQRCGIGDDCGSCHRDLRNLLALAAAARDAEPVPVACAACADADVAASASV